MKFSELYINSPMIKSTIESLPEEERDGFIEDLRSMLSSYDQLIGPGFESTQVGRSLAEVDSSIPNAGILRPPRRR